MSSNPQGTRYHVVLPNSSETAVLLCLTDDGAALPSWFRNDRPLWEETPAVNQGVLELLNIRVATLRACKRDWTDERSDSYYVVESLDPEWEPPAGLLWANLEMVSRLAWSCAIDREVLLAWFADEPSPTRAGWYRPGWFASSEAWIDNALEQAGLNRTGDVEQLRTWERSSIMRFETDAGMLYYKAVARQWGHEPALTQFLAHRFPNLTAGVVAADAGTGRFIVREYAGIPLSESRDIEQWIAAYSALGRVQRELADALPELRSLGVPFRDLDVIAVEIPAMLADRRRMRQGMEQGLSDVEIATLQSAESRLIEACRRLAEGSLPLSLDHGDFWPGNIYVSRERITLFDWSDATITHPFFSLVMAADEIGDTLKDQPGASERVIDAYLREWSDYGPLDELREIFDDAMLVAPLHLAIMYGTVYLPAMEFVDELDRMTTHFLRWLVGRVGG